MQKYWYFAILGVFFKDIVGCFSLFWGVESWIQKILPV